MTTCMLQPRGTICSHPTSLGGATGFGFEPEVTAKISKIPKIRIYEVGVSYYGRTYDEGKKINWKDGFRALYCIVRYGLGS